MSSSTKAENLRFEQYKGLIDNMQNLTHKGIKADKMVILPFIGSPRAMQRNFQDAMSLVGYYDKQDLFITMTCNPQWDEKKFKAVTK